jgi:hypothetical protein
LGSVTADCKGTFDQPSQGNASPAWQSLDCYVLEVQLEVPICDKAKDSEPLPYLLRTKGADVIAPCPRTEKRRHKTEATAAL